MRLNWMDFIDQVLQLQEPVHLKVKLIVFVEGWLPGRAGVAAADACLFDEIITALKEKIVREHSKIIESKLSAVRFYNGNLLNLQHYLNPSLTS